MSAPLSEALQIATQLCKHFEGFRAKPYLCPAGYWTIGYGTVYKPDGKRVTEHDPAIDESTALSWLKYTLLNDYLAGVLRASPNLFTNPKALGALNDFAYNLGVSRYRASTLRKRVEESNWDEAILELRKWRRSGGKILPGLVRRREAEAALMQPGGE